MPGRAIRLGAIGLLWLASAIGCEGPDPAAFHQAARDGDVTAIETYIAAGGDLEAPVEDRGANLTAERSRQQGWTAIELAAGAGHDDVVQRLANAGAAFDDALHIAVWEGHAEATRTLIAAGAAPGLSDHGLSVLMSAALAGQAEMIDVIIDAVPELEVDERTATGHTALHYAKTGEVVDRLLSHGADIESRTKSGDTPLLAACGNGETEAVKVLLRSGARLDAQCSRGHTALHIAAGWDGRIWEDDLAEMIDALLAFGADLEAVDSGGETPLMHAAGMGTAQTVRNLIAQGADPMVRDHDGRTAIEIAQERLRPDPAIIAALEEAIDAR